MFRYRVIDLWRHTLQRGIQKDGAMWEGIAQLANDYLPKPCNLSSMAECSLRRQTPEVGATCGKAARGDPHRKNQVSRLPCTR